MHPDTAEDCKITLSLNNDMWTAYEARMQQYHRTLNFFQQLYQCGQVVDQIVWRTQL
jgi:hypothetical protein